MWLKRRLAGLIQGFQQKLCINCWGEITAISLYSLNIFKGSKLNQKLIDKQLFYNQVTPVPFYDKLSR